MNGPRFADTDILLYSISPSDGHQMDRDGARDDNLGWRQDDLPNAPGVGTATIQRIEKSDGPITDYVSAVMRIEAAFEKPAFCSSPMMKSPESVFD
jgi:hypothetical protein